MRREESSFFLCAPASLRADGHKNGKTFFSSSVKSVCGGYAFVHASELYQNFDALLKHPGCLFTAGFQKNTLEQFSPLPQFLYQAIARSSSLSAEMNSGAIPGYISKNQPAGPFAKPGSLFHEAQELPSRTAGRLFTLMAETQNQFCPENYREVEHGRSPFY